MKVTTPGGYVGTASVKKIKRGYEASIRIPFVSEEAAQQCLEEMVSVLKRK